MSTLIFLIILICLKVFFKNGKKLNIDKKKLNILGFLKNPFSAAMIEHLTLSSSIAPDR